jgi:hypothetical protein
MTQLDKNRVLFFGGKGFSVTNHIHILFLGTNRVSLKDLLSIEDMSWKKYAFGGNPLVPRWGHTTTLHGPRVGLYGGRDETGYWNTLDVIDVGRV